jgi:hypothetical protein
MDVRLITARYREVAQFIDVYKYHQRALSAITTLSESCRASIVARTWAGGPATLCPPRRFGRPTLAVLFHASVGASGSFAPPFFPNLSRIPQIPILQFPHFTLPTPGFSTPYHSIRTLPKLDLTTSICFAILSRVFATKFSPAHPPPARSLSCLFRFRTLQPANAHFASRMYLRDPPTFKQARFYLFYSHILSSPPPLNPHRITSLQKP